MHSPSLPSCWERAGPPLPPDLCGCNCLSASPAGPRGVGQGTPTNTRCPLPSSVMDGGVPGSSPHALLHSTPSPCHGLGGSQSLVAHGPCVPVGGCLGGTSVTGSTAAPCLKYPSGAAVPLGPGGWSVWHADAKALTESGFPHPIWVQRTGLPPFLLLGSRAGPMPAVRSAV